MHNSTQSNSQSPLLTLPRELRDEIYGYLLLPDHVYACSPKPKNSIILKNPVGETYIDARIWVPARLPSTVLSTCNQLREETLDYLVGLIERRALHPPASENVPFEESFEDRVATSADMGNEIYAERARGDGSVLIALEIMRPVRGNMGEYIPTRDRPSPTFMTLLPLLSRLRKVKFVVWCGSDWWYGPSERRVKERTQFQPKARFQRMSWDQTDEPKNQDAEEKEIVRPEPDKPDPLAVAIGALIKHLPLVEEVTVDVLMRAWEYTNLSLPDTKWEHVQGFLDSPVFPPDGRRLKKVYRKLIAINTSPELYEATFYHKLETWEKKPGDESGTVVHVSQGSKQVCLLKKGR